MADKNKRIAVTLDPDTYSALKRLSDASGIAMSTWGAQILSQGVPVFHQLTAAFEALKTDPTKAHKLMANLSQDVTLQAAQMTLEVEQEKPRMRKKRKDV